jgi:hypothetical protein
LEVKEINDIWFMQQEQFMKISYRLKGRIWYETVKALRSCSSSLNHLAHIVETKQPILRRELDILRRNASFALLYKGKRAFVIGNGPSLNSHDLRLLKGEITFTCNAFYLHPILSEWKPTFHSVIDPNCFDDSEPMGTWFEETCSKMPNTMFFTPFAHIDTICNRNLYPKERTYFCSFSGYMSNGVRSIDITRRIPGGESVSIFSICLAMYMGCNPIYLLGMDHDWLAQRTSDKHFYEGTIIRGAVVGVDNIRATPYELSLRSMLRLWEGYKNVKHLAQSKGIKIYNSTNAGFLDIFERVEYKSLFPHGKFS